MGMVFFAADETEVAEVLNFDDFIPLFERMPFAADASSLRSLKVLLEILLARSEVFLPTSSPIQPPDYIYQLEAKAIEEIAALDYAWLMEQSVMWAEKGFLGVEVNPFDCAGMIDGIQGACKYALEQNRPLFVFVDDERWNLL